MPTGTTKLHLYRLSRVLSAGRGHPRGEPNALEPKTQRTGGLTGRGQVAVLDSVYRRADPMLVAGFAGKPSFARWLAAVMTSPRHGPSILGAASDAHGPLRCRPLAIRAFRQLRWRRRITVFLAMAVLLAGLAQAAHYHRDNLARGSTDVHCLLCLFAASRTTPGPVFLPLQQLSDQCRSPELRGSTLRRSRPARRLTQTPALAGTDGS